MRYRDLFKSREFTALYVTDIVSTTCSFLARIAVAALVFDRTHSAGLTAATIGISYAPFLLSPWLSTVADHYRRRTVLVVCEVARALLTALILIPGLPVWAIIVLIFLVESFHVPWGAARLSLLTELFSVENFSTANALLQSTGQALQLAGYFMGGLLTAAVGPRSAIAADAASYLLACVVLAAFLQRRPAPVGDDDQALHPGRRAAEGLRLIARNHRLQYLLFLLAIGPAAGVVSEGLAIPLADELGHSTPVAGVIMASSPLGQLIGMLLIGRASTGRQRTLVFPLAWGCAALVALAGVSAQTTDLVPPVVVLLTLASFCLGYLIPLQTEVAALIPNSVRGRIFGLAQAILQLAQGAAILIAGAIASRLDVGIALIITGAFGVLAVLVVGGSMRRPAGVHRGIRNGSQ